MKLETKSNVIIYNPMTSFSKNRIQGIPTRKGNYLEILWINKKNKISVKTIKYLGTAHKKYMRKGILSTQNTGFVYRPFAGMYPSLSAEATYGWLEDRTPATLKRKQRNKYKRRVRHFVSKKSKQRDLVLKVDKLSAEEIIRVLMEEVGAADDLLLTTGGMQSTKYPLNARNWKKIMKYIKEAQITEQSESGLDFSDYHLVQSIINVVDKLIIHKLKRPKVEKGKRQKKKKPDGAFFPFYNLTKLDLTDFGIYKNKEEAAGLYSANCFIKALRASGIKWRCGEIINCELLLNQPQVPRILLNRLSRLLGVNIYLKTLDHTYHENYPIKLKGEKKAPKYNRRIELGLIAKHYFIIKDIPVTKSALINYEKCKHFEDWNTRVYCGGRERWESRPAKARLSSWKVIKHMYLNRDGDTFLRNRSIKDLFNTQYYGDVIPKITDLTYDEPEMIYPEGKSSVGEMGIKSPSTKENKYSEPKKSNLKIHYCDFETDPTDTSKKGRHKAFLVVDRTSNAGTSYWTDEKFECGHRMLLNLKEDSLLIFHNAGYDIRFLMKFFLTGGLQYIKQGRGCCLLSGKIVNFQKKTIRVVIHDSWKKIPTSLGNFKKWGLTAKGDKEVFPYNLYTPANRAKKWCLIEDGVKVLKKQSGIKEKDIDVFRENIEMWGFGDGDKFNIMAYCEKYCQRDCEILQEGYEAWEERICEITKGLHINDALTLSSLANKHFTKEGCYDGCYKLSGIPRYFIQQSVVGGMVRCAFDKRSHQKMYVKDGVEMDLEDTLDAVSLYPSSMTRLADTQGGYLMGKPKPCLDNQLNLEFLNSVDGYFVEIKVNKINKKRAFPVLSLMTKGSRKWINNHKQLCGEPLYVDKFTLEDAIKYQGLEYEIIRGYYYDEGRNPQIGITMPEMFNERLKLKAIGCPSQIAIKAIMNLCYGTTITKPHFTQDIMKNEKEGDEYIYRNYNYIKSITKMGGSTNVIITEYKGIEEHFNNAAIGCEILGMSKRIMREVMYLAEDKGIKIRYCDTDSCHLNNDDIPKLEKAFMEEYGRELIGKEMSQFHSDLELKDENGKKCKNVVAIESYYLGKKMYIHRTRGEYDEKEYTKKEYEEMNLAGKYIYGHHIRMKGVPDKSIIWYAKQHKIDVMEVYKQLYEGQSLEFDLTKDDMGKSKLPFDFRKNFTIGMKKSFSRKVKASSKKGRKQKAEEAKEAAKKA